MSAGPTPVPNPAPTTVAAALAAARDAGLERLDAQWLLGHVLAQPRTWLLAHDDAELTGAQAAEIARLVARRAQGEPLAYLVGEHGFHGLMLEVDRHVLVPRPDTEVLVDWAIERLTAWATPTATAITTTTAPAASSIGTLNVASACPRVLDLGTGSGAIALAVKSACPSSHVVATDLSAAALEVARRNGARHGLEVEFRQGAWWSAVRATGHADLFDLVLSNPPYIAAGDPHLAALRHEPALALTPGGDGLDALRQIVGGARAHLAPGGWLLLEHGFDQSSAVRSLLQQRGFDAIETRQDLNGQPRCTGGRLP